jgi:YidC/Oxa1 family membrane protein insertase
MRLRNYLGAKRYSRLVALPYGLEETVRFGWFGFLSKPLYFGLEWIHRELVPNYGWAIVLITVLIKILFFPLTHKSQESMGKMQELNPKVQAIRAKYRGKLKDKQGRPNLEAQRQMNEEVMKVYKSAGVNPASGCLPILLQMPVFFALFRLLSTAVELRNAPWILWIRDLSAPDPYFILPIVMGATSLTMQRMMPSSPDPMQRRMMQMMPLVFVFFAFAFPSGLVLYWVTNNILTMGQQALLLKLKKRREDGDSGKGGKDDTGKKDTGKKAKSGKE